MINQHQRDILKKLSQTDYGNAMKAFIEDETLNLIHEAIYEADSMEKIYGIRYMLQILKRISVLLNLPPIDEKTFQQYK